MNDAPRHPLRVMGRCARLAGELGYSALRFAALSVRHGGTLAPSPRARWLQHVCRRVLRVFSLEHEVHGPMPTRGLLVCNHLSYLDILVLSATTPCIFVAKLEVRGWPVFGWFASRAGTLFLQREARSAAARVAGEIRAALDAGMLVVLFPEGTTSDGRDVLPFKSSLLEAAVGSPHDLSAGHIAYTVSDGSVADEVCYWRDMTLVPHLLNLLRKQKLGARLRFTEMSAAGADRKQLAQELRSAVVRLRECDPHAATSRADQPPAVPASKAASALSS